MKRLGIPALLLALLLIHSAGARAMLPAQPRPPAGWWGTGQTGTVDPSWQVQTVDQAGDVGRCSSLALDAAGRPHIAYVDSTRYVLDYASFDGTAWLTETVISLGGWTNECPFLALDAAGRPHIAYVAGSALQYAHHDGSGWQIETLASSAMQVSLALDAAGRPRISYVGNGLRYVWNDGTGWQSELVDTPEGWTDFYFSSLALDAAGRPHIAYSWIYYTGECLEMRYAHRDAPGWSIATLATPYDGCWYPALALDAAGRPHIGYYDQDAQALQYARFDGTAWITTTVDRFQGYPWEMDTSLALDAQGHPAIAYGDGALKYAAYDGAGWFTQTVDNDGTVGTYGLSLALDAAGRPRISYYDQSNAALRYADRALPYRFYLPRVQRSAP